MSLFISYREITYVPSDSGVRIIITTDVPCHAWLRVTATSPNLHKKISIIRGLPLKEDIRFCFVVFGDFEQFEAGDTYIHTFYIEDWPAGTTKWFYPFASVAGIFSVSTGPFFEYHNTGIAPVPVPDAMYHLNSVDPELRPIGGGGAWIDIDLSYEAPLGASGVILCLVNSDAGQEQRVALRKPGTTYDLYTDMMRDSITWVIVGLSSSRQIQARAETNGRVHFYVMGFTGPKVVFPDTPIDIFPTVVDSYHSTDINTLWPDARLILTDLSSSRLSDTTHSIRPSGSSKELYQGSYRKWPFSIVGADGNVQTKLAGIGHPISRWLAYAYIPDTVYTSLNGIDLGALTGGAWTAKNTIALSADARWAFVEMTHAIASLDVSIRKRYSYFDEKFRNAAHAWLITHVDESSFFQIYSGGGASTQLLLAGT